MWNHKKNINYQVLVEKSQSKASFCVGSCRQASSALGVLFQPLFLQSWGASSNAPLHEHHPMLCFCYVLRI